MEKIFLLKSIIFILAIWGISIVLLWFRPKIEIFWKIIATLLFVFYIFFFLKEIQMGYQAIVNDWFSQVVFFGKEIILLVFVNLVIFWPLALIVVFYKADDIGAENIIKFMCIFTLIIWIIVVIYVFQDKGINKILYEKFKELIPFAK